MELDPQEILNRVMKDWHGKVLVEREMYAMALENASNENAALRQKLEGSNEPDVEPKQD